MKYELRRDKETNAYYLGYYIPSRRWDRFKEEDLAFTKNILKYKDYNGTGDRDVWADFTIELMGSINKILDECPWWIESVHMVAVPSSNPNKRCTMRDSIKMIANLSSDGVSLCRCPLVDKSGMIVRAVPIRSSHMSAHYSEKRPDIVEHINSMRVTEPVCKRNVLYLIMDDIVTSGNTLWACFNKLLAEGVDKRNIRFLAIGKTL